MARASGAKPAILLNARRTQTSKTISLESVFPGEELFFRQLVNLAGLLDRDRTCLDCSDNRGLATYYPSAGVRRWQTFSEQGLDQRIIKQCTFRIPNIGLHYQTGANTNNFVASLTYRFGPLPADLPPSPEPRAP